MEWFVRFDMTTEAMEPVEGALTGHIGRRSQDWCPRGDSLARHGALLRSLRVPFAGGLTVERRSVVR
jgi:hypothetical protein